MPTCYACTPASWTAWTPRATHTSTVAHCCRLRWGSGTHCKYVCMMRRRGEESTRWAAAECRSLRTDRGSRTLALQEPACRSHTLVFRVPSTAVAAAAVQGLGAHAVLIDKRGEHVRIGFGPNHSAADVDALLAALRADACAAAS